MTWGVTAGTRVNRIVARIEAPSLELEYNYFLNGVLVEKGARKACEIIAICPASVWFIFLFQFRN